MKSLINRILQDGPLSEVREAVNAVNRHTRSVRG